MSLSYDLQVKAQIGSNQINMAVVEKLTTSS